MNPYYFFAPVIATFVLLIMYYSHYRSYGNDSSNIFTLSQALQMWIILTLCVLSVMCIVLSPEYKFDVIIHHCNGKDKLRIRYEGHCEPIIHTERVAVPEMTINGRKYLNYCDVTIISKVEMK